MKKHSLIILSLFLSTFLNAEYISTPKNKYDINESISIKVNELLSSNSYWLGIYPKSSGNVWTNVVSWPLRSIRNGLVNVESINTAGTYEARLFYGNTYSLIDTVEFDIRSPATNNTSWWKPKPGTTWQWQLSNRIDTSFNVAMYDIDLVETPQATIDQLHAQGRKVVCYFSAGTLDKRRPDAYRFPRFVTGNTLTHHSEEKWLDIRRIDILSSIMQARLDLAVEKNCDGVEPDNIDGYDNSSGFPLTFQDQLRYNIWLAKQAHQRGLSIGLKNDLDQVNQLVSHFDWAINEQCYQYTECYKLKPFIAAGKAVFGVEYNIRPPAFCHKANRARYSWLYKNDDLDAWVQSCHNR